MKKYKKFWVPYVGVCKVSIYEVKILQKTFNFTILQTHLSEVCNF